jgi:hypothetical protein
MEKNMLGSFSTIGHNCALFQKSPAALRRAMKELNLQPVITLNSLHYYRDEDFDAANRWLNLQREPAYVEAVEESDDAN